MNNNERRLVQQVKQFEQTLSENPSWKAWSKKLQQKTDQLIPAKIHQTLANALEKGIKHFLQGVKIKREDTFSSGFSVQRGEGLQKVAFPKENREGKEDSAQDDKSSPSRSEDEWQGSDLERLRPQAEQLVKDYKKIASLEGAGTGFGGIIASTVDFPALISIKLRLMQELAYLYGYSMDHFEERLFVVKVMQLQFSGVDCKQKVWREIKHWETEMRDEKQSWETFDWEEFYLEYKQSIELPKLLQIVPGFGAIVGALANHSFLDRLGQTAILCYQWRKLQERYGDQIDAWF